MAPLPELSSVWRNLWRGRVKQAQRRKLSRLEKKEMAWGLFFISPWMIGFLLFYFLPMIASFGFSLYDFNPAVPDQARFVGFANWQRALFQDEEVWLSLGRTLHFAAISLPISLLFALFLAILLNSEHVLGKSVYRTLFYMPTMIPLVATVLIWNGVLNEQAGWINVIIERLTGITATGTQGLRWLADPKLVYYAYTMFGLWGVGNAMIIFLAGLQGVPTELYEAAQIDGANWFHRLIFITIPLITPVIFYQLVLGVIGSLQYFLAPFVLNGGTGFPEGMTRFFMVYFYKQSFSFFSMGYGATLAWLMLIIAMIITVVLFGTSRFWVFYAGEER
ncbi:carbohydrate ABC transporter permease [Chloroflexus aggregans]|uniref:Binding-protein-dependent transport systems inner membrane component n=1 Tax=Chloroflexus aggregans (strain MD-66 / DSM 9485) TaxID=326427 RepID=B8GAJ9_CHLAD|nr:sugar ABC transporter permease [Chloroflexus aggregans]ACL24588.1 binding-protein-dependent transport systems inner membrane component [Chloroflexus aggregans DSM 9485]